MLCAFGFERVSVLVSDLYFIDPEPLEGQESAERGVRLEVRMLERGDLKGSIYSAQPIGIGRPAWRADLLESVDSPPGSLDRAHHHPSFTGWEPGHRVFDAALSADPVSWVGEQLADLEGLLRRSGIDRDEPPAGGGSSAGGGASGGGACPRGAGQRRGTGHRQETRPPAGTGRSRGTPRASAAACRRSWRPSSGCSAR